MKYPFFVNNFDRVKNYRKDYPSVGKIFEHPVSFWYGERNGKEIKCLYKGVRRLLKRSHPQLPIFVLYNFPDRDLGQYSKGGAHSAESYMNFIDSFCKGIEGVSPIVIFEPDAVPHNERFCNEDLEFRVNLMKLALQRLCERSSAHIYVDIGHSSWLTVDAAHALLEAVSNPKIRGFSLNTSNYRTTAESMKFGLALCELRPNDHFVIDTSRNGNGPFGLEWCNPPGRALGTPATCETGEEKCDAFLWVKIPGESDGKKNGGPRAGRFWPEMAEKLISASPFI
jgi:endoglucanase